MEKALAVSSFQYDNTEKWMELVLKCTELVSVNSMHGYKLKGEATARVFDAPWTQRFKSELRDQLIFTDPRKYCPWLKDQGQTFYIAVKYVFKQYFWQRDVDNVHKVFQDMIAEACGINDSHITEVHIWKNYRPGDYEYMIVKFGVSNYDYNQFQ